MNPNNLRGDPAAVACTVGSAGRYGVCAGRTPLGHGAHETAQRGAPQIAVLAGEATSSPISPRRVVPSAKVVTRGRRKDLKWRTTADRLAPCARNTDSAQAWENVLASGPRVEVKRKRVARTRGVS